MRKCVSASKDAAASRKAISDTAMITLEAYAVAGVPLAREFVKAIREEKPDRQSWIVPQGMNNVSPEQAVLLRARYLGGDVVVRRLVTAGKIKAVVERAAGMYSFGFNITRDLPVTYVETDISQEFEFKPQLCSSIATDLGLNMQGRLLFAKMDAITLEGVFTVLRMLRDRRGPIGFIDAGLMIYQTEDGFRRYVDASKRLLELREGSLWIATDMSFRTREFIETMVSCNSNFKGYFDRLKEKLGVDYKEFFQNSQKQTEFLEQNGLEMQGYTPLELGYQLRFDGLEKSTMSKTSLEEYLRFLSENFRTLVLRLRK